MAGGYQRLGGIYTSVFTEVESQVRQLVDYIGKTLRNVKVMLRLAVNQFVLSLTPIWDYAEILFFVKMATLLVLWDVLSGESTE
jgi:hypothetical protein